MSSPVPCDDMITSAQAAPTPPNDLQPSAQRIFIGSGDTFFIGTLGMRWSDNLSFDNGAFHMKIGIYTLDRQPPRVSVVRSDGRARGSAASSPTSQGLPGPLPTTVTIPTRGCWTVEARGASGSAVVQVDIQS